MDTKPANPLTKHFRQPAIYIKLPSGGQYWPEGSINLPINSEIPIYSMTTKDEITLRTPDALMNGQGVVSVIESCCPNIIDGWKTPNIDVDALLVAIRIASYGQEMVLDTKCPHCDEDNKHGVDLRPVLDGIKKPDYTQTVNINDLKIKLRPRAYFDTTNSNNIDFEEQKLLQAINSADLDEDVRAKQISDGMKRLINAGIKTITSYTEYIESDGHRVVDPSYIEEFYENTEANTVREVQQAINNFNEYGALPSYNVECDECHTPYKIPVVFDYAAFFVNGS